MSPYIAWTCPECGAKNGCKHLPRNLTLEEIRAAQMADHRPAKLEAALRALLIALDTQHLDGKPLSQYHYSGNVQDAMGYARSLVTTPKAEIEVPEADRARTCDG